MEGDPSLSIGPLKLWVTGRASIDSGRRWPSDIIAASFSLTTAKTEIIALEIEWTHVSELKAFVHDYASFQNKQDDFRLAFKPMSGCLWWYVSMSRKARIYPCSRMTIYYSEFQADALGFPQGERHRYWINLTEEELERLIQSCRTIIREYPERYS